MISVDGSQRQHRKFVEYDQFEPMPFGHHGRCAQDFYLPATKTLQLNYDLTAGFLNLMSNFIALMLLLARVDDRRAIVALYNVVHHLLHGQSEPSYPRLGQMIVDYEQPLRQLSDDFASISGVRRTTRALSASLVLSAHTIEPHLALSHLLSAQHFGRSGENASGELQTTCRLIVVFAVA